jgi:hypothetical protein
MSDPIDGQFAESDGVDECREPQANDQSAMTYDETLYGGDDTSPTVHAPNAAPDIDAGLIGAPETPPPATEFHWHLGSVGLGEAAPVSEADTDAPARTSSAEQVDGDQSLPLPIETPAPLPVLESAEQSSTESTPTTKSAEDTTHTVASEAPGSIDSEEHSIFHDAPKAEAEADTTAELGVKSVKSIKPFGYEPTVVAERIKQAEHPSEDDTKELATAIDQARTAIDEMKEKPDSKQRTPLILLEKSWSPEVKELIEAAAPPGGWPADATAIEKFAAKDRTGKPVIGDDTLLQFLQWHTNKRVEMHNTFVNERLPEYLATAKTFVEQGVRERWLPPQALRRLQQVRSHTTIYLDDGRNNFGTQEYAGIFVPERDAVYLDYIGWKGLFIHEDFHAHSYERDADGKILGRSSLERALGPHMGSILVEAVAEHLTVKVVEEGKGMYNVWPSENDKELYQERRLFLDTVCRYGKQPVDIRRFIDAFYEGPSERSRRGPDSAEANLRRTITRAFPNYLKLKQAVAKLGKNYDKSGTLTRLTDELRRQNKRKYAEFAHEEDFTFAGEVR